LKKPLHFKTVAFLFA